MSYGVSSWIHRRRSNDGPAGGSESQKVHYSEEDEMEDDDEDEDLSEVSPSGDVERMIGGGCPAAYRGSRRVSADSSHQGMLCYSPISNLVLNGGQRPSRPASIKKSYGLKHEISNQLPKKSCQVGLGFKMRR